MGLYHQNINIRNAVTIQWYIQPRIDQF